MKTVDVERLAPGHRQALPDARRADPHDLARQIRAVSESPVVEALLDAVDTILLVLNEQRQIVACNGRGARLGTSSSVLGLRPGEALACVNARAAGACGTSPSCEVCGTLGAILRCERSGRPVEAECLLRSELEPEGALELNVRASPVHIDGFPFTVVSLRDISGEKRRQALEQIFFHDVLNTVAGLRGWALRLRRSDGNPARAAERVEVLTRHLEREIRDHRALMLAEAGTLVPNLVRVRAAEILQDLEAIFSSHASSRVQRFEVQMPPADVELISDPSLLLRVLVNMARNALEATESGGTVRVWCERWRDSGGDEGVRFSVRNDGVIPPEVQARIFQRSFSTKAERGRGLGTYGMKLLGERYLGGEVSFVSAPEWATVFSIRLPLAPAATPAA